MNKVFFNFGSKIGIILRMVLNDVSMLEECNARTDVEGVSEVVGRDNDGGTRLAVIVFKQVLHRML